MGHIARAGVHNTYIMPLSLMIKTLDFQSPLYSLHERLAANRLTPSDYHAHLLSTLRGKKGLIRRMNTMNVQGAVRMVIAPDPHLRAGTVSIPKWVASRVCTPYADNGVVKSQCIRDGDRALLVRQPCMWSGGIQAVTIRVSDDDGDLSNLDCSMRLPMQMCAPYAADYDGDEMTLFPVYGKLAIAECDAFQWNYQPATDEFISGYHQLCVQPRYDNNNDDDANHDRDDTVTSVRAAGT